MAKTDLFVAVAHFANGVKAQIIAAPTDIRMLKPI
jgi:hypothetical protein